MWQVKYEKDGYETAYSEWLPVPPPQTEVNIGMRSLGVPEIEYFNLYEDHAEVAFSKYMVPLTTNCIRITDCDGTEISYVLKYDTTQTDLDGNNFADEYRLIFEETLQVGEEYTVDIADVWDYAGISCDATVFSLVCENEVAVDVVPEVTVPYGTNCTIPITVTGKESIELTAMSSSEAIVSVVTCDRKQLTVNALIPGEATIEIYAEGFPVLAVVKISSVIKQTESDAFWTCGDINKDGQVLSDDAELFVRYFAGESIVVDPIVADVDNDGTVTRRDAMILSRCLAGREGYTLPYEG